MEDTLKQKMLRKKENIWQFCVIYKEIFKYDIYGNATHFPFSRAIDDKLGPECENKFTLRVLSYFIKLFTEMFPGNNISFQVNLTCWNYAQDIKSQLSTVT